MYVFSCTLRNSIDLIKTIYIEMTRGYDYLYCYRQGASGSSWLPRNPFSSCATCTDLQKKIDQLQEEKSRFVS